LSRFDKWNASSPDSLIRYKNRTSGSVCGLDPDFCGDQDSGKWPDDITKWPICEKPTLPLNTTIERDQHMHCEIIGRPCCIGIQGECLITTLEHCSAMRGYFHNDAHLCAQVDCMQDVCGMIDFLNEKSPDQVYRLFTSIFIHAGIVQLLITVIFQLFILRDVEKLAGCLRVAIIYTASGVIGNLGSAIFLPYQAEVGPLGSQFGIIACLFVEMFHAWEIYSQPWLVFLKLVGTLIVLVSFILFYVLLSLVFNYKSNYAIFHLNICY
jgi:membrane associated rhomboid family serine protease